LDELDDDCGKRQAAIPPPLAAGGSCEPFLSSDEGKRVLEDLEGMLFELQEGQARLQAVHNKTKIMQTRVIEYVEQRLREHSERLENKIAQEVRRQLGVLLGENVETMSRMNSCSTLPSTVAGLLPSTYTVASEQQEDHLEQDLLMQKEMGDELCLPLVAIEQQIDAAAKTAELAEPALLVDLSQCEASVTAFLSARSGGDASHVSTSRKCSRIFPERSTSPEQPESCVFSEQRQQQQLRQKACQSHLSVRGARSITGEALSGPDRRQRRHRADGSCSKRHPGRSR